MLPASVSGQILILTTKVYPNYFLTATNALKRTVIPLFFQPLLICVNLYLRRVFFQKLLILDLNNYFSLSKMEKMKKLLQLSGIYSYFVSEPPKLSSVFSNYFSLNLETLQQFFKIGLQTCLHFKKWLYFLKNQKPSIFSKTIQVFLKYVSKIIPRAK